MNVLVTIFRFFTLLLWPELAPFAAGDLGFSGEVEGSGWLGFTGNFRGDFRGEGVGLGSAGSSLISGSGGGGEGTGASISISITNIRYKRKCNMHLCTVNIYLQVTESVIN